MPAPGQGYGVRAVAHVHSLHSDGTATVAELRAAVRAAGARVLLLTDHDSLGARDAGEDGWGAGVLVVCGHEVTPKGGHLLVFGTEELVAHDGRGERQILDAVTAAGGFGIAAHPFSRGSAISRTIAPPHAWSDFEHPALAGVEVWSLITDMAERWRSPAAAWRSLRDPLAVALEGPPAEHLARWDRLAARRPLAAIGGLDAHAPGLRIGGRVRSIQPHRAWFPLVQTVLYLERPLSGEDGPDSELVLAALRAGATAIAVPPLGDPLSVAIDWDAADRPAVTAPPATVTRVVEVGGRSRIELLRPARGGLAPWLLTSPARAARAGR